MANKLQQLQQMTLVVADTGDFTAIKALRPQDATTNPSLILQAAQDPNNQALLAQAWADAGKQPMPTEARAQAAVDILAARVGCAIQQSIPGYVSTEVSARLSFDTRATVEKARRMLDLYAGLGGDTQRVLVKIAATWEGIQAAQILEKEGIGCNLTLLFSFAQARACADAGVTLISPFVGRILDWYQAQYPTQDFSGLQDPGVQSVQKIYQYYKTHGYSTIVMGASFRNQGQIESLAGCDRLTISPKLLQALAEDTGQLTRQLHPQASTQTPEDALNAAEFRWQLNEDAMATEKLADGIRRFMQDQQTLENLLVRTFA
ncbi:transaldolase [Allopseudospirillum japonicum]|uniref:Transaldolase n=1 Tax=Allopseudospirillum japonicum TaxID=64971 RepID=A0A1H6RFD9_9GAMM|nr:transaldolase [Allopseudospirillum japonicum]SEI50550.1 transaldolase [Allopseudospirillum japonicum]